MSAILHDPSTIEALPAELAALPSRIGENIVKAGEGLDTGNLSKASVHLLYLMDSASFTIGHFHPVTVAVREFRATVLRAFMRRTAEPVDLVAARRRCRRVLLAHVEDVTRAVTV